MTISFPLNLPANPGPTNITFRLTTSVARARSPYTFATQKQRHQGQMWRASFTLPVLTREQAQIWRSFLHSLDGPWGTFYLGDPERVLPLGLAAGNPRVNGASQAGGVLVTDGWSPSVTGILKADDHIQIGTRLYAIKEDADSDGSGNATLQIWPDLRSPSPADNEVITTVAPTGIFQLSENDFDLASADNTHLSLMTIECEEAI